MELRLHPRQGDAFQSDATEILYGGAAGGGKALDVDTPIPTPDGWTAMGDLCIGDSVYDEQGAVCRVVAASEVMHSRPCLRVEFSDGEVVIADADHQWLTFNLGERAALARRTDSFRAARRQRRPSRGTGAKPSLAERNRVAPPPAMHPPAGTVRTTMEIAETVKVRGRTNHSVKVCPGIQGDLRHLPVDPYVLGAWLGDGTSSQSSITTADGEVIWEIQSRGYGISQRNGRYHYGISTLLVSLRELNLLNNKHVPLAYLRASTEQRLDLLRGLMDTDGTATRAGSCEFYTTSKALADGVRELLVSLGVKAKVNSSRAMLNGTDYGELYKLKFSCEHRAFGLTRKAERQRPPTRGVHRWRMIDDVKPVDSRPVRCIQVDSPSAMFLAGAGMIPTHNSHLFRVAAISWCVAIPGLQVYFFRRNYPDLLSNHMDGPGGFPALLAEWIGAGHCKLIMGSAPDIKFTNGSTIHLRHCQYEKDVYKYQGPEIHVLIIDELTQWLQSMYKFLRSRVRLGGLPVPAPYQHRFPRILTGANPGGIGHNWVKMDFIDPAPPFQITACPATEGGMHRQYIPARLEDNPTLVENDPLYKNRLEGMGNEDLVRAMRLGDWNIVAGGAIDDVWDPARHVINPFPLPASWRLDRAFDWGSSHPFAVGWFAESDGTDIIWYDGTKHSTVRGDLFLIAEWYGWNGQPNEGCRMLAREIAIGIKEREQANRWRVEPGPADTQIFDVVNGHCLADDMAQVGIHWTEADKSSGSRVLGLQELRTRLKQTGTDRPGLYIFESCRHWLRTVPTLPRDERKPDDVDTEAEDHCVDFTRYRLLSKHAPMRKVKLQGL